VSTRYLNCPLSQSLGTPRFRRLQGGRGSSPLGAANYFHSPARVDIIVRRNPTSQNLHSSQRFLEVFCRRFAVDKQRRGDCALPLGAFTYGWWCKEISRRAILRWPGVFLDYQDANSCEWGSPPRAREVSQPAKRTITNNHVLKVQNTSDRSGDRLGIRRSGDYSNQMQFAT